ncbi:WPP domain-associated protein [Macadamia integrifolia]|uniref:WPP domain-associated protein n=1 Tax=Macadamia integrifolia TaxID=60698 RepID=UPI001C4ED082|nr:WPP domain-associated protein [Macadamia integrifolia]
MGSSEVLNGSGVQSAGITSPGDGFMHSNISFKEVRSAGFTSPSDGLMQPSISFGDENLGTHILDDLDSYLEDINDRLTISRKVSDSVIKEVVNAVIKEAAEKLALKELEVQTLNKRLQIYEADADKVKELRFLTVGMDNDGSQFRLQSSFLGTHSEQGRIDVCFGNLSGDAEEQFQRLQKDINNLKEFKMADRTIFGVDSHTVGDHFQGKVDDKWEEVDKTLNMLRVTVNAVFHQVNDMVYLSKTSISEWQQEREFQEEIEAMVIQNSIKSLQQELKIEVCSGEKINQLVNEISSLRQELDFISKSLSSSELGHLPCHGSHESGEECNAVLKDNINQKASSHISLPSSLEENGKLEPKISSLDRMDSAELKHKSSDELIIFFKAEMAKMNRNHESILQEKIEEYFALKRESLKERGPQSLRRDKDFDSLKKKIPEVMSKLDGILKEKKELPVSYEDCMNIRILKDRLDALHSENRLLKNFLANEREEVKHLSSQLSNATDKTSHHSMTEVGLLEEIRKLNCVMEDLKWDVSVREEINICLLRDVVRNFKCDIEDSETKFKLMQDICRIILRGAVKEAEAIMECGVTDSDMEYIIMQEVCGIIHREAFKNAQAAINLIVAEYEKENEQIEETLLETKKSLRLETEEKEQLKREQFSLLILMAEKEKESDSIKSILDLTLKLIGQYEGDISKLDQKLKLEMEKLSVADGERRDLQAVIQEKQATISLLKSKEREHGKEMECIMISIEALSKAVADFKCRLTKNVEQNSLRLEKLTSQCHPLVQRATEIKRTGLAYKQRLERRCSDLQKAESEVDLLGDEVDALLNLLEKIYIALDHYSPILQHYPGIMEILKLVRRELSGETVKLS